MECEEDLLLEAANALLLLSRTPPLDLPPAATINLFRPLPRPPAAMPARSIENVLSVSLPSWGFRSRRSRLMGKLKLKRVEGPLSSTAVAATCGHRSPDTPLDLGAASDPSTSGSDGFPCSSEIRPFKRLRTGDASVPACDAHIKVSVAERSALVEAVRPLQPIKRQGRKKKMSELQAEERFLLEDKEKLMKMLEFEIIEREALLAENQRLLSELASSQRPPAEAEPSKLKYFLPDLNAPVLEPFCEET
ncbi:uncharacterized protein LOC110100289 [Dendrobium catenatum]|uniref:Uncharacterized protein n=1 Tax=Dendrobium catenatum TaxID=906689 RepID=A0A2I0VZK3_9ASPA|nr:uncharacterized protein LOC110100289 [Dendrobium catenatum]PKU68840.1 hypothetical protein MA16_Dca010584 [Dendrobium catenatum]